MINVGDKTEPAGTPRAAPDPAATASFDVLTRFLLYRDVVHQPRDSVFFFLTSVLVYFKH